MHRFRPLLIVLALVLAAAMAFATGCKSRTPQAHKGRGAGFTLKDLSGKAVSLDDYKGKVVLLEFWATWCPPCRLSVPDLIKLEDRFKDRDFALIAVSLDESEKAVRDFVKEEGINYTVLMDNGQAAEKYGVFSIPTSFIIDRDGTVLSKHAGYTEDMISGIADDIEDLLSGKKPTQTATPAPAPEEQSTQEPSQH